MEGYQTGPTPPSFLWDYFYSFRTASFPSGLLGKPLGQLMIPLGQLMIPLGQLMMSSGQLRISVGQIRICQDNLGLIHSTKLHQLDWFRCIILQRDSSLFLPTIYNPSMPIMKMENCGPPALLGTRQHVSFKE